MPPLYLVDTGGRRERYVKVVPGSEYILGRSPSADLVLDDSESSKQHANTHRNSRWSACAVWPPSFNCLTICSVK